MQTEVNKRRAQRQKKARRRRLKTAFIFFLIIALLTLAIMCFTVFFPIKRINVSGSEIYSKSEIIKASKLSTDDNLLVVSEDEIENNIRKSLPYVDSVKLKRVLPDAVILTVTDAKEYAYYQSGDSYFILSDSGYILKQQQQTPENVFQIVTSGIEGEVAQKAVYKNNTEEQLVNTLIAALNQREINIDKIDISNILQITLEVEGRFTVVLGTTDYTQEKIAHLAGMIESITDRRGKINLSMWTPTNSQGSFVEEDS
ncbi:MAG: FtsQ-type POTRA domain-containing protein [Clostridia bacterium]|nr:FtsQ-type POTRA domain-containing protein [Clostridia bacterium]